MAESGSGGAETARLDSSTAWRKRVAVLVAIALAAAGLLILERSPASAATRPHVVHATTHPAAAASTAASADVANLNSASSQLRGAASLITQTKPNLDAASAASAADLAASANSAAALAQKLASLATSKSPSAGAQARAAVAQLQATLASTQAKAAALSQAAVRTRIPLCNFTIQIGPIIINIPAFNIHIQIGPFLIHFRAPCFLSGRLPTHIP